MDEREDITEYVRSLKAGEGLTDKAVRDGYQQFKAEKNAQELAAVAEKHRLTTDGKTIIDWHGDSMPLVISSES